MSGQEYSNCGVIFDLDGTIINSAEDIVDSLRLAYLENRIHVDGDLNDTCIGPPLKDMICALTPGLTQEQVSGVIHSFRRIYDTSSYTKTKLYDGVHEVVKQSARRNIPLFVATNKPKHAAMSLIRKFELGGYLREVMTPDSGDGVAFSKSAMLHYLQLKWNLHAPYFVGDSAEDILAARENNLMSIAVLYGYGKKDSLLAAKPHYIVDTAIGILSIILNNSKSEGHYEL